MAAVNVTISSSRKLINMMELIGVGLRSVMMFGSGVLGMKLIDGHRCKLSRQGGMKFKHFGSLWRLL
jgi:hypothetical protein